MSAEENANIYGYYIGDKCVIKRNSEYFGTIIRFYHKTTDNVLCAVTILNGVECYAILSNLRVI